MARQKGIIKLKGTIGDVSFYKSKDGYLAREKGGVDAARIKNDPAFQRTRENGSEFGRAGKSGRVLRNAFRILVQNASDSKVTSRVTKEMLSIIKTDAVNVRGERTASNGDLESLKGFDFNNEGKLNATLFAPFSSSIDRALGDFTIVIPAFVPIDTIAFPPGATHVKFVAGAAEIDFENEEINFVKTTTVEIPLGSQTVVEEELNMIVSESSISNLILVLGLEFLQEVNGSMYPLKNGSYNPLMIIDVEKP